MGDGASGSPERILLGQKVCVGGQGEGWMLIKLKLNALPGFGRV